jgi:RNA polymerase sigma-70 factor (ECF subfamily)
LEELVRTWERPLLYYIRRLVHDETEAWDILQKTWLRVLRGISELIDPRSLSPWLFRVARNTAFSHTRLRQPMHEPLTHQEALVNGQPSEQFEYEDAEQVHRALLSLSLPHREVLTLFFLEDLSVEEVATVLGVPPGTVKSRLHYAKAALRKVLQGEGQRYE